LTGESVIIGAVAQRVTASLVFGDRRHPEMTDLVPGARLGCRTVLILTRLSQEQLANRDQWEVEPDHIAPDLLSAVQWVLVESET